jgi:hypothetical protein
MDLEMPIMNGWLACQNLMSFFNEEIKLFKLQNKQSSINVVE